MKDWYILKYRAKQEEYVKRVIAYIIEVNRFDLSPNFWVPMLRFSEAQGKKIIAHKLRMFPSYGFVGLKKSVEDEVRTSFLYKLDVVKTFAILREGTKTGWRYYKLTPAEFGVVKLQERLGKRSPQVFIRVGEPVEIRTGLFKGVQGVVERIEKDSIFVSILFMGTYTIIEENRLNLLRLGVRTFNGIKKALKIVPHKSGHDSAKMSEVYV